MTQRTILILLAGAGSLALLLGAFGFQYLGGLAPCKLCLWQRWPHAAAVLIAIVALWLAGRSLPLLGALAAFCTAAFGTYHTGVERGWWEGPNSCSAGPVGGMSGDDLMAQIMAAPLVRCDEVTWEMLSLSMASWNAIASVGLMVLWLMAAKTRG